MVTVLLFNYLFIYLCMNLNKTIILNSLHRPVYSTSNILVKLVIESRNCLRDYTGPLTDALVK